MRNPALILLSFLLAANLQLVGASATVERCPFAPTPRLYAGMQAVIVVDSLNMRALPAVSTGIETRLYSGTTLTILSGPSCNSTLNWWRVEHPSGRRGWVAEGTWESYYLIPAARANVRIPTPLEWSCPASRPRHCITIE